MRFTTHQVRTFKDLKPVYELFDFMDDRYIAGFENYPAPSYTVVVAHGRNDPQGVAVLVGNIITAFVVSYEVEKRRTIQVWDALIVQLQTQYYWLIFHDATMRSSARNRGLPKLHLRMGWTIW